VVLSACQTNLGDLSEGDELVGLTRAFIFAGTPSVIASLWSVEDESTALLMERFYTHLREGAGKAEALRQAQIEVRDQDPNPYYWAAFVLSGDGGKVGDVQPMTTGKVVNQETEVAAIQASPAVPEPTPLPEPVAEEEQSQTAKEPMPSWSWPSLVGGLLVVLLPIGGAVVWRRRRTR
jgi:hypothetical protein